MAAVRMYIDKFQKEVLIDEDHPLAIAQRAKAGQESGESHGEPQGSSVPAEKPAAPTKSISRMNRDELLELCVERGLEVPEDASKKDIIALLEGAE